MSLSRRTILGATAAVAIGRVLTETDWSPAHHPATETQTPQDLVVGAGAWCWFQSPRAALDASGTLWIGSSQGSSDPAPGAVDVCSVDLTSMRVTSRTRLGTDRVDDHTSPSVLPTATGIQVGWAPHRRADWLEIGTLGSPLTRIHRPESLTGPGRGMSYVSAHLVGPERWLLYRGEQFSWNLLSSTDGESWTSRGLVVAPPPGGHRPYLLAAGHGDQLHFLVTDGNPSEFGGTSVWAGSVSVEGTIRDGSGRKVGAVGEAPALPRSLTLVEAGVPGAVEAADTDAWLCDLQVIRGQVTAVLSVRDPWPMGSARVGAWRHRYRWARQADDGTWAVEHLAWAGSELYERQPDYTGLASLDPTDPGRVVVSTNVHPHSSQPLRSPDGARARWELFEGRRTRDDAWSWRALTSRSPADNLRPVIAASPSGRALIWIRGRYESWGDFDTQIVVRQD